MGFSICDIIWSTNILSPLAWRCSYTTTWTTYVFLPFSAHAYKCMHAGRVNSKFHVRGPFPPKFTPKNWVFSSLSSHHTWPHNRLVGHKHRGTMSTPLVHSFQGWRYSCKLVSAKPTEHQLYNGTTHSLAPLWSEVGCLWWHQYCIYGKMICSALVWYDSHSHTLSFGLLQVEYDGASGLLNQETLWDQHLFRSCQASRTSEEWDIVWHHQGQNFVCPFNTSHCCFYSKICSALVFGMTRFSHSCSFGLLQAVHDVAS